MYAAPPNATMPMRSLTRSRMNSRTTCFTIVNRSTGWPCTLKSIACMLPETSTAKTISIPSVRTSLSLRPSCGRARAITSNTNATPRNSRSILGPNQVQNDPNPRAAATEEY